MRRTISAKPKPIDWALLVIQLRDPKQVPRAQEMRRRMKAEVVAMAAQVEGLQANVAKLEAAMREAGVLPPEAAG